MKRKSGQWLIGVTLAVFLGSGLARADTVLFILDVSGSMAQKLDGGTKMDAAKQTLNELIAGLPPALNVGLEVYGHHGDKDCSAIEVVVPPQPLDVAAIRNQVNALTPQKGATPIADALRAAGNVVRDASGARSIVLISDGKETCGGDPAATAQALLSQGVDVTIHVIGFGVGETERVQLQAVAKAGGGNYYDAQDAAALKASLQEVKKKVTVSTVVLRDDFNGDDLADHWEVANPSPDMMIVEDGTLQIIAEPPDEKLFNSKNLLILKQDLPENYEVEAKLALTQFEGACTGWTEAPTIGLLLYKDPDNVIGLIGGITGNGCGAPNDAVHFVKLRGGNWQPGFYQDLGGRVEERPLIVKLRREKRKFSAFYRNDDGDWVKLGEFSELRPQYRLAVYVARGAKAREALQKVDWIELRELK